MSFEPLLTQDEVSALLGVAASTLEKMRMRGDGPPFTKIGRGRNAPVRYSPSAQSRKRIGADTRSCSGRGFRSAASLGSKTPRPTAHGIRSSVEALGLALGLRVPPILSATPR